MSKFQEEFDKRLRRVCGITDDTKRVRYDEDLDDSIEVSVYYEKGTYQVITVAQRTFAGLADLMRAVDEVEL